MRSQGTVESIRARPLRFRSTGQLPVQAAISGSQSRRQQHFHRNKLVEILWLDRADLRRTALPLPREICRDQVRARLPGRCKLLSLNVLSPACCAPFGGAAAQPTPKGAQCAVPKAGRGRVMRFSCWGVAKHIHHPRIHDPPNRP